MRFALCKEWQRVKVMKPRRSVSAPRQSRWLSKERGCGRGKRDRCQNKGDSKSGPDWETRKSRPLAGFAARCSGAKLSKNEKKTVRPSSEHETMILEVT